jgi:hypothetical protein
MKCSAKINFSRQGLIKKVIPQYAKVKTHTPLQLLTPRSVYSFILFTLISF